MVILGPDRPPPPVPPDTPPEPPVEEPPDSPGRPPEPNPFPEGDPPSRPPRRLKAWGKHVGGGFERMSVAVTRWAASSWGFAFALVSVLLWAFLGPSMRHSPSWHALLHTGTAVVTFLMVFLIERSQSKDARAIQLKLNEIVAALAGASNRLVAVEELSEQDLEKLHQRFRAMAEKAGREDDTGSPRSVDDSPGR